MALTQEKVVTTRASYWQIFRVIFVIFCLYLMGDAFYRWDGFRYYASFSEFLPNVALITILWSIVAGFTALLVWLPLRAFEWFCVRAGLKIKAYHLMLFAGILILTGTGVWSVKQYIWTYVQTSFQLKLAVFFFVLLAAVFFTWLFRRKSEKWIGTIQKNITPLVWLFGIWVILALPILAYHTWGNRSDNVVLQKTSQSSTAKKKKPNIILVTFDALTARDMSVYGYNRPTTPFISEWAKTASLFTRLQAESNATTQTVASLMTGKRLWTHQTYHIRGSNPFRSNIENLPLLLKKSGYYTMAFIANDAASLGILGISNSFDIVPNPGEFSNPIFLREMIRKKLYQFFGEKIRLYDWIFRLNPFFSTVLDRISRDVSITRFPPERVFNEFSSLTESNSPEPFFAWIHLFPPHSWYLPPEPYMGKFDSSPKQRTFKSQKKELGKMSEYPGFTQEVLPSVSTFRARYDEFIRYCDKQFENFIGQLEEKNKLKDTVIILSSDHGESFEHDYLTHGGDNFYEQVTHIPLIIKEPGQTQGRVINDIVEQIDIPATILEFAKVTVPSWMEGRSLVPLMKGEMLSPRPAFSMNFEKNPSRGHQITKGTIAVWEGDYKLIHYLEEKKSLLFNLKQDPDELNNLFDREAEVGQRLLALIQDNLKKANEKIINR